MKLGKLAPKPHPKTLKLSKYLKSTALPIPPEKAYYEYKVMVPWNAMGNTDYGNCTCAGPAHEIMVRTAHTGQIVVPTTGEVLEMYSVLSPGFDPVTDVNDNGAAITDALNYMQTTGLAGHKIAGWAQIDNTRIDQIKLGLYLFGTVNIGVNLPQSAMDQTNAGQSWRVVQDDGGIVGGHCIPIVGYGRDGCMCVTWGALQPMHWDWFLKYCDESYCEIAQDWLTANGTAVNHLDMTVLQADLQAIAG